MLGTNPGALAPATLRISTLSVSLPAIVEDHFLVMIKFQFFSKVIFLQSYTAQDVNLCLHERDEFRPGQGYC